nr:uncharacterized protein LOC123497526 [Aegilops tauschii subsp. strangulata]
MAKMDFCEVIVESIKEGAKIWQKHMLLPQEEKNKKHLNGLAQGPVIMYLDSLLLPTDTIEMRKIAKTMDKTSLPRANHLKESDLKKIARADMKRDGKARPDDYEFGKIKTWKGTTERIFYASTITPSYSIQMIPAQQQEHQQTMKLLPPPTKRQDEAHVSTSGSKEPVTGTSTGSYEIFGRIEETLKQVLDETKQIPGIKTRAGHQCSEQEEELDENMKNSVVQQTTALIDSLEQLRKFQDIVCRVSLPEETTLKLQDGADAGATAALGHGKRTPPKHKGQQQHVVKNTKQEDGSNRTSNPTTDDAPSRASTGAVQETNRIGGSKDVLQAHQREEDAHAIQNVDIEELFSTRAFQMTDTGEKASDTAPGDTPKAGIQSEEKVDAQTDIPTTGAKPQDKNDDTTDEQNEKDPEELQKPPLKEEKLEEAAPAETTEKKPQQDTHADTSKEVKGHGALEDHAANIPERKSDNNKKKAAPSDKKHCAIKDVAATNTTVSQDGTQIEREPLIIQNLAIEEGTKDEGIERLYNNVMTVNKDKGLDCAFYMFMNAKHYTDGGETVYLTEEQVPELRKKILYQIISQYRDTAALSLINYTKEEIPPTPEHIGTSAQEIHDIDINDTSSDEEKEDYHVSIKDTTKASEEALTEEQAQTDAGLQREQHAQPDTDLQKEDEQKDPPIEPDRPPPNKKTEDITGSTLEGDNRTKSVRTSQQELSKQNKNLVDEDRKPGTSPEVKHAQEEKKQKEKDLIEKILEQRKHDAAISVEPSIKNNSTQKESPTPRQPNEQAQLGHDKKKHILGLKDKRKSMKNFRVDFTREKDVLVPLFLKKCQSEKLKTAKMVSLPFEKEDRYTLLVLDRYRRKLQIIEPEETSLEELKKQEYLKNQRDRHVHDGKLIKQIANMENNEAIKEKEHNKYHYHKDKLVPREVFIGWHGTMESTTTVQATI